MKLISLYIEKFGGLKQYSLKFDDGVTVIQQPNGFGKTTLAEFIRAMFYGFPRKAKTLDKSKRQKYTPWDGGKFGGNLVFEIEGTQYRIERTFGATPRSDTFNLIDLQTNRKSERFSEEIGVELFRLDADSFERSTYMPQLHDAGPLTTDSIRAKLGDLVEDTNDVGNFDKAMAALRAKRSSFIPYRGNGGSVAEAAAEVSRIQAELERVEAKKAELDACHETIAALEAQTQENGAQVAAVRAQITRASEAAAAAAVHRQYENMAAQYDQTRTALEVLQKRYPQGVPQEQQLEEARRTADYLAVLEARQVTDQEDLDAARFLAEHKQFEAHVPTPAELEACRAACEGYQSLAAEALNAGLSDGELAQYEKLRGLYESGALEENKLDALTDASRELLKVRHSLEDAALSKDERLQLAALERYFAPGLPTEEEILAQRQNLVQARQLRQENLRLTSIQPAQPKKAGKLMLLLLLVLGVVGIVLGIVLLAGQNFLFGGIALGAGVLALVGAVYLNLRQMVAGGASQQPRIEANEMEAAALEQEVHRFAEKYAGGASLEEELRRMQSSRNAYLSLRAKQEAVVEKQSRLTRQAAQLENVLRDALGPAADFDRAIVDLRLARTQYLDLKQKKAAAEAAVQDLQARGAEYQKKASDFLGAYYQDVSPEKFSSLLNRLQRDSEAYTRAKARLLDWDARKERHGKETAQCRTELEAFFTGYGLTAEDDIRSQLQRMGYDRRSHAETAARLEKLTGEKEAFEVEHAAVLAAPAQEPQDAQELKSREARLNTAAEALTRRLLEQRQQAQNLRAELDRIPELRDALERFQEEKAAGQKKSALLDDTMDFLQKAKDSLSTSYLGPVRRSFAGYMDRLTGENGEKILVTPDLEVQLERLGQARELAYFSAGQTDMVMLCMRLALVDALFKDRKPFVILDDPFVNLDDEHTAEALALLRELAKERQIVYLVCNSSRSM